ncbi:histone deacetylase HDT2-like [Canna indica]|uniref:Histone deacetylase HDT2-like n=1 Tax=Canna indica TaxID=4628 RepID=A0AAQ3QAA4_9LILI|nr:histone deacetylase HDT2-like [Canna indica]
MEFWGIEVLPGETVKVDPGENKYLHLSQASLGEAKKEKSADVPIFVKFDNKKLVLGTLSSEKCAQIQYDLVFEKEFELSHGSKNTSISFLGYKTAALEEGDMSEEFYSGSESEEEEIPLAQNINGKLEKDEKPKLTAGKSNVVKPVASVAKPKPKAEEPKKDVKGKADEDDDEDEDDDDEDDSSEEVESDEDEDMVDGEDDSDDEDEEDSSDEEEEATPKKVEVGNKRPAGSASKTPVPEKKAKLISPVGNQKSGKKGGGHVATPHPAKQGKTPANSDKSKQQTPKSAGSVSCKSCSKTFNSDNALQAHTKAKHSASK